MALQRMDNVRLRTHGAELVGEVAQYEDSYLLCYVRGPAGIIVALAEQLGWRLPTWPRASSYRL
jgi:hypothetical protein